MASLKRDAVGAADDEPQAKKAKPLSDAVAAAMPGATAAAVTAAAAAASEVASSSAASSPFGGAPLSVPSSGTSSPVMMPAAAFSAAAAAAAAAGAGKPLFHANGIGNGVHEQMKLRSATLVQPDTFDVHECFYPRQ